MRKNNPKNLFAAIGMLVAFVLWTALLRLVDVRPIGPEGSLVGFATVNRFVHNLTGVHMWLYHITDWLGLVPLGFVLGFGALGLIQWIKRKHITKVDYSILVLGGFYMVVMAVYVLFEELAVNYRPVLIDGFLEASYPSSTTLLVLCVMPTAIMQFQDRMKNLVLKRCVCYLLTAFVAFMVIGRFVSGVHWFTDIVGGGLLSAGLVMLYRFVSSLEKGSHITAGAVHHQP
jgi:undecaprenyl-diphosphatase